MTLITIPKKLIGSGDLVVIPKKEYNELVQAKIRKIEEVELTKAQKKALNAARKRIARGKFLTFNELKTKLGVKD